MTKPLGVAISLLEMPVSGWTFSNSQDSDIVDKAVKDSEDGHRFVGDTRDGPVTSSVTVHLYPNITSVD